MNILGIIFDQVFTVSQKLNAMHENINNYVGENVSANLKIEIKSCQNDISQIEVILGNMLPTLHHSKLTL